MDFPEAAKATAAAVATATASASAASAATVTPDSPPVQESPFSNYICNLSPIKPVKVAHAAQGYVGLNSPPLVFMSPPTLPQCETSIVQRTGCFQVQGVELAKDDDEKRKFGHGLNDLEKSFTHVSGRIIGDSQKNNDMKSFVQDLPGNSSNCDDDYFSDPVKMDSGNSLNSANASKEKCIAVLHSSESSLTASEKVILEFDGKNDTRMRENSNKYEHPEKHPQEQTCLEIRTIKAIEEQSGGEWLPNDYPSRDSNLFEGDSPKKLHYGTLGSQVVQVHEGDSKDVGDTLHEPDQNMASQLQRGMSRRCLQFEEAKCKTTMNSMLYPGPTNNSIGSRSPVSSTALESLNSPHLDLTVSTGQKEMIGLSRPILPSHYNRKPPSAMSRPSGIGLHLNSIVTALPMGCSTIASAKTDPVVNYQSLENKSSCSKLSELLEKVPVIAEDGILGAEASLAENKRKFESEDADNFEVFNQSSPKKKRKKLSSIEADGCKRCNCKKTECLKLYCDCFAAGIYCAEPCACRGCFNRPEYEDTVLEFRQKIEARNPLAFSPKIVQRVTKVSAIHREDGYRLKSPSARHKKGCNCKKSMCLKKYCECYQANVGCSSGCRCEGCKNAYGRKEDYDVAEAVSNKATEDGVESTVDYKMEIMSSNKDINAELYDLQNFKPLTPSFQNSEHGKDAPYSRLIPSTYTPSPESDLSSLSYAKFAKARNLHDTMFSEISGGSLDKGSCDQGAGYNTAKMNDQLSLECNGLADICDPNSLLNSSMTMASLGSSNGANISRVQWCPGSTHLSSGSSLRWRSSPLTPMTQLGETQRKVLGSDSGLYGILEDDTPEILNESSTLVASVKASSPNKKRVSPPRPIHELESGSSAVLKRGRKFILKAVPSFPPLTPCIDSKRNVDQQ